MTNREWLATLTDEQIVKFIRTFREDYCECCAGNVYGDNDDCDMYCYDGQVKWLSMKHDNEGWEERAYRYCV